MIWVSVALVPYCALLVGFGFRCYWFGSFCCSVVLRLLGSRPGFGLVVWVLWVDY